MISPDSGNMGVKAVYVWAGLLVPTTILLWLYYPEVSRLWIPVQLVLTPLRPTAEPTGSLTSFMSERSQLGSSGIPQLCPTRAAKRTRPLFPAKQSELPFPLELPIPTISSTYGQKGWEGLWNLEAAAVMTMVVMTMVVMPMVVMTMVVMR